MVKADAKIRIKVKSFDHRLIDYCVHTIIQAAQRTGALVKGPIPLPTKIEKITVLKSTFVHKDARDQYETRTHRRLIDLLDVNQKTVESLATLNLPSGVDIEIKTL